MTSVVVGLDDLTPLALPAIKVFALEANNGHNYFYDTISSIGKITKEKI